jgi:hypothetical protein
VNRQLRWARGEDGTSLVLALAFITMFGVFAALLAQFGAESFKTTAAVRDQRALVYAAEGAVDTAIDSVRTNTGMGQNGGPCFGVGSTPSLGLGTVAGHAVTATCTGQVSAVGGVNATLPSQALLTTATGSEDGVTVLGGTVKMDGGIFSNSGVTVVGGALDTGSSPLTARGSCNNYFAIYPWMTITGNPVTCDVGAGGHTEGNDPNYPSPLSSVPTHQNVPSCPATGNKVITFNPGFYDDDVALNALTYDTSTNDSCHNAVLWFKPGQYYFDFDWRSGDSSHTWVIDDSSINIVGGTPKNWSPTNPTRPTIPLPNGSGDSGSCKSEKDAAPNTGVQFVFGGDSNVAGWTGNIELCATPDAAGRELAIYGQKTGSLAPTTTVLDPPSGSAGYTSLTNWPAPANALALTNPGDHIYATSSPVGRNSSASITVRGYPTSGLPAVADFSSVTMKIVHHESNTSRVSSLSALVTANGQACGSLALTPSTTDKTETFTGSQLSCINDLSDLNNLTVKYTGTTPNTSGSNPTFSIDGIEFSVTYTAPTLRAESGCVTIPSNQSGDCDLIALSTNFTGSFFVNGTVYAPLARFTLELGGAFSGASTRVQFTRGAVLRAVILWDGAFPPAAPPTTMSIPPSGRTAEFVGRIDGIRMVLAVFNFVDNTTLV